MHNVCTYLSACTECECEPCNPYVRGVRVQFLQGLFGNIWHSAAGLIICAYLTIKLYWASPGPAAFISGDGVIPTPDGPEPSAPDLPLLSQRPSSGAAPLALFKEHLQGQQLTLGCITVQMLREDWDPSVKLYSSKKITKDERKKRDFPDRNEIIQILYMCCTFPL